MNLRQLPSRLARFAMLGGVLLVFAGCDEVLVHTGQERAVGDPD